MKRLGLLLLVLSFLAPAALADGLNIPLPPIPGVNMPWAPSPGDVARHTYRYFPDAEVYFDPARALYFFRDKDVWVKAATLPARILLQGLPWGELKMNDDVPYRYHEEVRKRYPPGQAKKMGDGTPPGHSKGGAGWKDDGNGKGKGKGR